MLCGTQRGETYRTRWTDLDLENRLWHIPAEHRNGKDGKRVPLNIPLSSLVIRLIEGLRPITGKRDRVFVGNGISLGYVGGWTKEAVGMPDLTLHDLRRSTSTGLQRIGCPAYVISVVLGHSREAGGLGFAKRAGALGEWQAMHERARVELMDKSLGVMIATGKALISTGRSLSPPPAYRAISRLHDAGVYEPVLEKSLLAIARVPNKPLVGAVATELLDRLNRLRIAASVGTAGTNRLLALKSISAVLGMLQKDPKLALLAADLDFMASSVYALGTGLSYEEQIEEITKLTVDDLQRLKRLSNQLRTDVERLNAARKQVETSCNPAAEPPPRAPGNPDLCYSGFRQCTDACNKRPYVPFSGQVGSDVCVAECGVDQERCMGQPPSPGSTEVHRCPAGDRTVRTEVVGV